MALSGGLVARLLGLVHYLQALPLQVVLTQIGLRHLVSGQHNRSWPVAQMEGAQGNERPMQRREQGYTHDREWK
jgi:hypothetical protein